MRCACTKEMLLLVTTGSMLIPKPQACQAFAKVGMCACAEQMCIVIGIWYTCCVYLVPGSKSSDDVEDMEVTPVAVQDPSSQKFVFSTSTDGMTTSSDTEPTPAVPSVPHDDTALTVDSSTPGIQAAPHSSDEVGQVLAVEEDEPRTESGLQLTCAEANQEDSDEMWYKFNDVNVTTVPWSEVLKESCGQGVNTSAYCFVYLSSEVSVHQGDCACPCVVAYEWCSLRLHLLFCMLHLRR